MKKKQGRRMTFTEKMVLLNELRKEDELRKMRMTDEEIISLRQKTIPKTTDNWAYTLAFARAIEERHGIK